MNYASSTPLHLHQVLEEEFVSLAESGSLSERERITLHGRSIEARLDWDFHPGHVKDASSLIRKLEDRSPLSRHLRRVCSRLKRDLEAYQSAIAGISNVSPDEEPPETTPALSSEQAEQLLLDALNQLLRRPLYNEEAFKHIKLEDSTLAAIKPHMKAAGTDDAPLTTLLTQLEKANQGVRFISESVDDLAHINRLILEQAFPDELEKISDIRLAAMYQRLHRKRCVALCLSGGGIRSGTFALGLLQRLARFGMLDKFDYLSTVSGGGYIGSWLTAWTHRHPQGLTGITKDLENNPPKSKIDPDTHEVQHLREYSNFLTPKVGLLTADTWTFVAIYLRNLLLNWMVLIPLLLAGLAIPRLNLALYLGQSPELGTLLSFGHYKFSLRHLFFAAGAALLSLALLYISLNRPGISKQLVERSSFWRKRMTQEGFLKWCLLPLVSATVLLTIYLAWSLDHQASHPTFQPFKWLVYTGSGVAVALLAFLGYVLVFERWKRKYWGEFTKWELASGILLCVICGGGGFLAYKVAYIEQLNPAVRDVDGSWATEIYACIGVPILLLLVLLLNTFTIGLVSRFKEIEDEDREWWARFKAWLLIVSLAWGLLHALVIFGPLIIIKFPQVIATVGGVSGLLAVLAGQSSKTPATTERATAKGALSAFIGQNLLPLLAFIFLVIFLASISLLTTILLPFTYALGLSAYQVPEGSLTETHFRVMHNIGLLAVAFFMFVTAVAGTLMAWVINLNKFSLHAAYRSRLIRAFLGASRDESKRHPNPFTGFDPQDNIHMHELRPALLHEKDFVDLKTLAVIIDAEADELARFLKKHLSTATRERLNGIASPAPLETQLRIELIEDLNRILENERIAASGNRLIEKAPTGLQTVGDIIRKRIVLTNAYPHLIKGKYPPPHKLLHVINLTLNLVGGANLAWQQRKAETFAVTPLHAGCFRLGYRKSRDYGGENGISLGTAAAISGAAVSSNMGYYTSSPVISLVLTLFNLRLGWWLGNPGPAGEKTFRKTAPTLSVMPILSEALGLTDDRNKYVYLSDGGHFENLALYEMVLRRCHVIVASDGAQDANYEFSDLGNAIRKIRIDLGVPIEFDDLPIYGQMPDDRRGRYWAFARIRYSAVDGDVEDGVLIYVKPAVYGCEPRDVLQYKKAHEDFPHQTTGDQFFDEPQFESYRMLGAYIMDRLCDKEIIVREDSEKLKNIGHFVSRAYKNYKNPGEPFDKLPEIEWLKTWTRRSRF